jgi:hypothetical protein
MATIDKSDIISWRVSFSLTSAASATVVLDNSTDKFSPEVERIRGQLITINVESNPDDLEISGSESGAAFPIFTGRIKSVRPTIDTASAEKRVELGINSVTDGLKSRPVTTETLDEDGADLMSLLLTDYGGLNPIFVDIVEDNSERFDNINVQENSLIGAVRKIADAANVEVFVGLEGTITTDAKKDASSAVDFTLSGSNISGVVQEIDTEVTLPSACRVRGRYITDLENSKTIIINDRTVGVIARNDFQVIVRVFTDTSFILSSGSDPVEYNITELQAIVAVVDVASGADSGEVLGLDRFGALLIRFRSDTNSFVVAELNEITFTVRTNLLEDSEILGTEVDSLGEGLNEKMDKFQVLQDYLGGGAVTARTYVKFPPDRQIPKRLDEETNNRLEVIVTNSDSMCEVGLRYMDIDNLYIQDELAAIEVGNRALLERRMSAQSFRCEGPWTEQLTQINKVVNLVFPYTTPSRTEKVLLTRLTVSFDARDHSLKSGYEFAQLL